MRNFGFVSGDDKKRDLKIRLIMLAGACSEQILAQQRKSRNSENRSEKLSSSFKRNSPTVQMACAESVSANSYLQGVH